MITALFLTVSFCVVHCDVSNTASGPQCVCCCGKSFFVSTASVSNQVLCVSLLSVYLSLSLYFLPSFTVFLSTPSLFIPPTPPARNPISNVFSFWVQSLFLSPSLSCLGSPTVNVLLSCVNAALCAFYVCLCMGIFVVSCVCIEMAVQQPRRKGRHRGDNLTVCATSLIHYYFLSMITLCLTLASVFLSPWKSHNSCLNISGKINTGKMFSLLQYGFYWPFDNILFFSSSFKRNISTIIQ